MLEETAERSLKSAGLWGRGERQVAHLGSLAPSGGQQQRLCIARAIAAEPEVLLMDEPCSALDPIATNKIEQLMATLRKQVTIVIVTHNMQQAARVADVTAFFYLGKLIEVGPTGEDLLNSGKEADGRLCDGAVWVICGLGRVGREQPGWAGRSKEFENRLRWEKSCPNARYTGLKRIPSVLTLCPGA